MMSGSKVAQKATERKVVNDQTNELLEELSQLLPKNKGKKRTKIETLRQTHLAIMQPWIDQMLEKKGYFGKAPITRSVPLENGGFSGKAPITRSVPLENGGFSGKAPITRRVPLGNRGFSGKAPITRRVPLGNRGFTGKTQIAKARELAMKMTREQFVDFMGKWDE